MALPTVRRRLWTRQAYDRVVAAGGFDEDDRIELLDGEIWEMTPQGTPHAAVVSAVHEALRRAFGTGFTVRSQSPFALDDLSEPEPDAAVVDGAPLDYLGEHPAEALLLVEVADSSLHHDRVRKLAAYGRNGVPEYWLLDLNGRRVEVYRESTASGYASKQVLSRQDTVAPLHAPGSPIPVSEILP